MTKRKVSMAFLACLVVALTVLMAVPMAASAASGVVGTPQWTGAAFMGIDNYYSNTVAVVAFKAGATAKLTALVKNEEGADITIKEAKVKFDWGGVYPATAASPTQIKNNETGVFNFEFTVPEVAVATSATMHRYEIVIGFQKQGTGYVRNLSSWDQGDNWTSASPTTFRLDNQNMVLGSIRVFFRDGAPSPDTITEQTAGWVADERQGRVTFTSPVSGSVLVYADYRYCEAPGAGVVDGTNTVFYTQMAPLVDGSLKVYLRNDVTEKYDAATVSAVDLETGKFTLASAPVAGVQTVRVSYEYWDRMVASAGAVGTNFVVYSADQGDAMAALQTYNSINNNYPQYLFTPGTAAAKAAEEAQVSKLKADAEYKNGDFAAAKADYGAAVTSLQAAIGADNTLNTTVETALTGLLTNANGVVDAYANKLNAEAKQAKGEASMYKNVGVFTILLGVATLLAGLGGIVWAYSRLVEAKRPGAG